VRIVLGRRIQFGNQVRTAPIHVHVACVVAALSAEDNASPPEEFRDSVRANSRDIDAGKVEAALLEIGDPKPRAQV
jgi:hypothetical protein